MVKHFRNIIFFLENEGFLDLLNEVQLSALHYIYVPRINKALEEFSNDWRYHPLSPLPEIDTPNNVEIPESRVFLWDFHTEELSGIVSPFAQDSNEGIDLYIDTVRII